MFTLFAVLFAAALPDLDVDLGAFAKLVLDAVMSGNWALVACLALVAVVWGVRKFAGGKLPFLQTKWGGWASLFLMSAAGAVATAVMAGAPVTLPLIGTALVIAFGAAGGWEAVKELLPLLLKFMQTPDTSKADAAAAGDAAVKENPAGGVEGILGKGEAK